MTRVSSADVRTRCCSRSCRFPTAVLKVFSRCLISFSISPAAIESVRKGESSAGLAIPVPIIAAGDIENEIKQREKTFNTAVYM